MTFWIVLAGILFLLWLFGRIRLRAAAAYSEAGFGLTVNVGPKQIQVLPAQARRKGKQSKKSKQEEAQSAAGEQPAKQKKSGKDTVSTALQFLPLVGEAAGRLKRKIRIDHINLYVVWGASDPADAAKGYGAGNAAMGILWPAVEHNFKVKEYDLSVDVDFEREKPEIVGDAQISITVGQVLTLVLIIGVKALKIYLGNRREKSGKTENEKAVQA